jgi:hypothetical protein
LHEAFGYLHAQLLFGLRHVNRSGSAQRGQGTAQRGQGTVEYVALVMLVALIMLGVVAAMKSYKFSDGQQLGDLIVKKIREAVGKVQY